MMRMGELIRLSRKSNFENVQTNSTRPAAARMRNRQPDSRGGALRKCVVRMQEPEFGLCITRIGSEAKKSVERLDQIAHELSIRERAEVFL